MTTNYQNLILDTTTKSDVLNQISVINQNALVPSSAIPRSKMLLVTLTTTIMMACDKPLPKEYYQYTRAYLETIKKDDGTSLPNISGLLKYIDKFEEKHNIEDEMQTTRTEMPSSELIEIPFNTFSDEDLHKSTEDHPLSSTKNENDEQVAEIEEVKKIEDVNEVVDENKRN